MGEPEKRFNHDGQCRDCGSYDISKAAEESGCFTLNSDGERVWCEPKSRCQCIPEGE